MLLMLYAHFEGFAKLAFEIYCRHINESNLLSGDVKPEIAACALNDVFKAFRMPHSAQNFLPDELWRIEDLRSLAIERTFIQKSFSLGQRRVEIPDKYVDTESNLKPIVLRKNLYRLGLRHDMFESHDDNIGELLGRRNKIAHGAEHLGVGVVAYTKVKNSVYNIMTDIKIKIVSCIDDRSYMRYAHEFEYLDPLANGVQVMGEFNGWNGTLMRKDGNKMWRATILLPPGVHAYKFLVNDILWVLDPKCTRTKLVNGIQNSAIEMV